MIESRKFYQCLKIMYLDGEIQEIVVGINHCETERLHGNLQGYKLLDSSEFSLVLYSVAVQYFQELSH